MSKHAIISVQDVCISKEGNSILKDINFEIDRGEYVGIIGPNGGGKTTLLRAILGLVEITSGKVRLHQCMANTHDPTCCIGYVPQNLSNDAFNLPFTVEELVRTGLNNERSPQSQSLVKEAIDKIGISHLAKKNVQNLSGGERQKSFLARALVNKPQILVLDEPFSALDEPSQKDIHQLLATINQEGTTILMVSHDINLIVQNVTKVLCIDNSLHHACHPLELDAEKLKEVFTHTQFVHHHSHA